jgi:uncharacterized membrane protein (UPF0127 family)
MSASLKILLYIFFVFVIFIFVQDKFELFDIKMGDSDSKIEDEQSSIVGDDTVEIYNSKRNPIIVRVELADNPLSKAVGLSGRKYLGDYEGMLFIMEEEEISSFWMKDMFISLDMIFIDKEGYIVDIKKNLTPCEAYYCPHILSKEPFLYVLEVNAGFVDINYIDIGNSIIFNILSRD